MARMRDQVYSFMLTHTEMDGSQGHHQILMKKRPGVDELLRSMAERFEMVVYTQGEERYALKVMAFLDPDG